MTRILCIGVLVLWMISPAADLVAAASAKKVSLKVGTQADALFREGKFAEAEALYRKALTQEPGRVHFVGRLGYIAMLSGRLDEAEHDLQRALKLDPKLSAAHALLAEVYARRDDFARAATELRVADLETEAQALESFRGLVPYQIEGAGDRTALKFIVTDPLPLVHLRVNGGAEVNFLIDTGAAELILDTEFAADVGAKLAGSTTGTFAGGKQAAVRHGRIESVTLGGFTIRNVPTAVMPTRSISGPIFGGRRVDGILGTVLLRHFLFTLDYPGGELRLVRPTPENRKRLDAEAARAASVPFWMAGDHFVVAWGRVNQSPPVLLFVDTGLAGGGLTCAPSLVKEAGIKLRDREASEGIGGGGRIRIVPFTAAEVSLGKATAHDVRGLDTGAFPLEYGFGFRMAGIISHEFFRPYALTFDFPRMRLILQRKD